MDFYRRKLPHWQPFNAEYFVTFRLAGSLPTDVISKLKERREILINTSSVNQAGKDKKVDLRIKIQKYIFKKYDDYLDNCSSGPTWLSQNKIANIVKEAIYYRDGEKYKLYAYCIMLNHVHIVFKLLNSNSINPKENKNFPVTKILQGLKWYTAMEANKILKRTGKPFWQSESYDHVIRDSEELERIIYYTLQNPVKARLTDTWLNWSFTYCTPEFSKRFQQP